MKVALCTRNPRNPVINVLARALAEGGSSAHVISDPRQLSSDPGYDVAFWRPDSRDARAAAFSRQAALILDGLGTPFLNCLASMERTASKFVSHALFSGHALPTPATWLAPRPGAPRDGVPNRPTIVKPVWSRRSRGVTFCPNLDEATEQVERLGEPCLLQEPIRWRYQYRCVVTRTDVVRVYRQQNPDPSTPAVMRFDRAQPHAVDDHDPEVAALARRMIAAVGGDLMRADILEDAGGRRWALEINASFGFPHDDRAILDAFLTGFSRIARGVVH